MENFTYHNPTRIHFGRGQIAQVGREIPTEARVLLVAGGGSIKTNGSLPINSLTMRTAWPKPSCSFWRT